MARTAIMRERCHVRPGTACIERAWRLGKHVGDVREIESCVHDIETARLSAVPSARNRSEPPRPCPVLRCRIDLLRAPDPRPMVGGIPT